MIWKGYIEEFLMLLRSLCVTLQEISESLKDIRSHRV